ncbi:MAG: L-histidine N(alpha)-methyltransferase, partial [Angustibacter sp.]
MMLDDSQAGAEVLRGLRCNPKTLPAKYFYDARGSQLFDRITRLPEYYPTRAERALLQDQAGEIARQTAAVSLVELGSGTSEKTQILLTALTGNQKLLEFTPFDVDPSILRQAAAVIRSRYPGLVVRELVGDFDHDLPKIAGLAPPGPMLVAFLGSTLGNY